MKKSIKHLLLLAAVLCLSGCIRDNTPIRIGTNAWPPCEIWTIAEQQNLFGSAPADIIRFSTWSDNMSSLYKGDIDITHATYFNAVYFQDKGEDGVIILSSDTVKGSDGFVVKSGLTDGKKLRSGKIDKNRLAVEINTDEHFLLKKALADFDLEEDDFEIISMPSSDAAEAFSKGDVDAAFIYEPYLSAAAGAGDGIIIWTTEDLPDYMIDTLVVRKEVLEKRKKDIVQIIRAWYDAQDYIRRQPEKAFRIMAANENIPVDSFAAFYNSFTFFTPEQNLKIFNSDSFRAKLAEMSLFLEQHNAITVQPDIDSLFTDEIVKSIDR